MFSTLHVHSTKIISFTHVDTRTHTVHVWTHSFLFTHMHHHICINMSMHIQLHTYKSTHHWFLAASSLNAAKGQSICVDPAFVSSFLASYRGSTKLCLQHFYDFSLLALLPSLNSNHRVYTILQNFTNGLNYVLIELIMVFSCHTLFHIHIQKRIEYFLQAKESHASS